MFVPFVLTKEKLFKKNGDLKVETEICFKSYIFIESNLSEKEFFIKITPTLKFFSNIYKILNYGDNTTIAVNESERLSLMKLYGRKHCIENSKGFVEGDKIKVLAGPLSGKESIIKKINRHKREAIIEIEIMGVIQKINVGLEIVKKVNKKN